MTPDIQTIFFDVGNTLRIVLPDQPFIQAAEAELMKLIGDDGEPRRALCQAGGAVEGLPQAVQGHAAGLPPRRSCGPSTCCRTTSRNLIARPTPAA
jgi:hypothetical protein